MLAVLLLLGTWWAARADHRGGWALVTLLTPLGLLSLLSLAGAADGLLHGAPRPSWAALAATAVVVALVGPALLPLAVALRGRVRGPAPAGPEERCPACGVHR